MKMVENGIKQMDNQSIAPNVIRVQNIYHQIK